MAVKIPRPPLGVVRGLLAAAFALLFALLAIGPVDRDTWLLENAIAVLAVLVLVGTRHRFPLSRTSYALIFAFLCIHEVGAHYTYSLVPYDEWSRRWLGFSPQAAFGFERNHYDRAVHFAYGLLLAYPVREFYVRVVDARGVWGYVLPLGFVMSTSMIYELIEWGAAIAFGGDLGMHYLGTQGDVWDAHWDMALASLGALVAMTITLAINAAFERDFARELAESLEVKGAEPLGEEALARMLDDEDEPGA